MFVEYAPETLIAQIQPSLNLYHHNALRESRSIETQNARPYTRGAPFLQPPLLLLIPCCSSFSLCHNLSVLPSPYRRVIEIDEPLPSVGSKLPGSSDDESGPSDPDRMWPDCSPPGPVRPGRFSFDELSPRAPCSKIARTRLGALSRQVLY